MNPYRRYRKLFQFQLDLNDSKDAFIAETIHDLKRLRAYTQTIRDGIRLICDLRKGKTDVLYELFPWVQEQNRDMGNSARMLTTTEQRLQEKIEQFGSILNQQMLQSLKPSESLQAVSTHIGGLRPLSNANRENLSSPSDSDDELIKIEQSDEKANTNGGQNLLNQLLQITQ